MPTTWTHCNVDIKILTKRSLDKADVEVISTHHPKQRQNMLSALICLDSSDMGGDVGSSVWIVWAICLEGRSGGVVMVLLAVICLERGEVVEW